MNLKVGRKTLLDPDALSINGSVHLPVMAVQMR